MRVSRVVTVIDAGRILNPLAGRNQIEGAVVMGIGMALLEHTTYDPQNGAPINSNLADYVVAVNADVPAIDVHFLDLASPQPRLRRSTTRPASACASCPSRSSTCSSNFVPWVHAALVNATLCFPDTRLPSTVFRMFRPRMDK